MKLHDLKPAPGSRTREAARRPGHRGGPGQDRRARHQGPEGACRRLDPGMVRGRPDAAPPAHPEAARLPEPVQDRVRGRQRRRDRAARRARCPRARRDARREGCRRAGAAPITVNQEILRAAGLVRRLDRPMKVLGGGELSTPLFVVADAFSASARAKIEGAGGTVSVLEVPTATIRAGYLRRSRSRAATASGPRPASPQAPVRRRRTSAGAAEAPATAEAETPAAARPTPKPNRPRADAGASRRRRRRRRRRGRPADAADDTGAPTDGCRPPSRRATRKPRTAKPDTAE